MGVWPVAAGEPRAGVSTSRQPRVREVEVAGFSH